MIMETVLIQINNSKAYRLLEDLEALNIIRVINKSNTSEEKRSLKYAGKLPSDVVESLQNQVAESRTEWNKRDI